MIERGRQDAIEFVYVRHERTFKQQKRQNSTRQTQRNFLHIRGDRGSLRQRDKRNRAWTSKRESSYT